MRSSGRGAAIPGRSRGLIPGVPGLPASEIDRVFRQEYGRAVAVLGRVFGDLDVAEEAVQDALPQLCSGGHPPDCPRARRDGSLRPPATEPSTASAGRPREDRLLALMLLVDSRRASRTAADGSLVLLADH
jgi:hypothetical protein